MVRSTITPAFSPSLSCYPHLSSLNPVRLDPTSPAPGTCHDLKGTMKFPPFALATSNSSLATKSFRIRTSAKCACNSCRIRTSETQDLKPFRMNTSKKTGVGEGGEQKYDEVFLSRATGRSEGTLRSALHRSRDTDYGELPLLTTHNSQFTFSPAETNSVPQAAYPRCFPTRGIAAAAAQALSLWSLSKC